jgi:hypothetical protein
MLYCYTSNIVDVVCTKILVTMTKNSTKKIVNNVLSIPNCFCYLSAHTNLHTSFIHIFRVNHKALQ